MPFHYNMSKNSSHGGRRPKVDPSVNRYVVRFNAEENARFLAMFEQSEADNKAAFIKHFLFQKPFKVFYVDENTRIFIDKLSGFNASIVQSVYLTTILSQRSIRISPRKKRRRHSKKSEN